MTDAQIHALEECQIRFYRQTVEEQTWREVLQRFGLDYSRLDLASNSILRKVNAELRAVIRKP